MVKEWYYIDHKKSRAHTNPHDHDIKWNNPTGVSRFPAAINYPDGAPEFERYGGQFFMGNTIVPSNTSEHNQFVSISGLKIVCDALAWRG